MGNAGTHLNQLALSTFLAIEARVRQFVRQQQGVELDPGSCEGGNWALAAVTLELGNPCYEIKSYNIMKSNLA